MSVWSGAKGREVRQHQPAIAEKEAVKLLRGVGGSVEWWTWNSAALIGHLRVPVTPLEYEGIPAGCAVDDAGTAGPQRARTR